MAWRCSPATTGSRSTSRRRSRPSISAIADGGAIAIEERGAAEVRGVGGAQTAPADSPVYNPAFDVTPAELITAIVTERGIFRFPYHFA